MACLLRDETTVLTAKVIDAVCIHARATGISPTHREVPRGNLTAVRYGLSLGDIRANAHFSIRVLSPEAENYIIEFK